MNGKLVAGGIVIAGAVAGLAMYWLQLYAFYHPVEATEIALSPVGGGPTQPVAVEGFRGIDSDSSPIRFRACFTLPLSLGVLTETYEIHEAPEPLVAPGWFDCFDAAAIGAALASGEAVAFTAQRNIRRGVDRVVAVFPDGRAYAWHQLNAAFR